MRRVLATGVDGRRLSLGRVNNIVFFLVLLYKCKICDIRDYFGEQLEMKTDCDDTNYTYEKLQNI